MLKTFFLISLVHAVALCWTCAVAEMLPGQLAFQAGNYKQARAEVDAALSTGTDSDLMLMRARISMAENQLDDARQIIDTVLEKEPDSVSAITLKGDLFAIEASRAGLFGAGKLVRESLNAYEAALTKDQDHREALTGMIRLRSNAPALFGGSYKQALILAERLRDLDPVAGNLQAASVYKAKRDNKQHVKVLNKIIQSHPSDPRAWLELGFVEQEKRNWQPAHDYFIAALNAAKDQGEHTLTAQSARYQIGRTAVLSKVNVELGIDSLSDYLEGPAFSELPEYEWAHYRRALLYQQTKRDHLAERDFKLAGQTSDRDLKRALRNR